MHPQINAFIAQTHIKRGKKSTKANEKKKAKMAFKHRQSVCSIYIPATVNKYIEICLHFNFNFCLRVICPIHT